MTPKSLIIFGSLAATMAWASEPKPVTLRGKVVEIYAEMKTAHEVDVSDRVAPLYGFKTDDGKIYTLLRTRRSLALFLDERLRARTLIIKGRQFPQTEIVEATFIQSVHDGVVHDLYYYCQICSIEALTPETCACCGEPVKLVEEPLKRKDGE